MMSEPFDAPRKKQRVLLTIFVVFMVFTSWIYRQSWTPFLMDAVIPILVQFDTWSEALPWNKVAGQNIINPDAEILAMENQLLQRKIAALELVTEENSQLRVLLDLNMPQGYEQITARVVLRSPHTWFETLLVNKGFEEGITVNMVVMNETGVIGKVVQVTARTSHVQLISHPDSSVSCIVGDKKVPGVLTGRFREGLAQLEYLQNYAQIHSGNKVLTSGLGGVYPPNLILGEVRYVHKKSTQPVPESTVALTPLEQNLEYVVILKPEI